MNHPQSRLEGVVVAQAATTANMMLAFGQGIVAQLREEGAEIHFFASDRPLHGSPPRFSELAALGTSVVGLDLPHSISPFAFVKAALHMRRELKARKVQILHTRGSIMGFVGRLAGWMASVPIIVHHQDDFYFREEGLSPWRRSLFRIVEVWLANQTQKTILVSNALKKIAVDAGINEARCEMVGHDLHPIFQRAIVDPLHIETRRHPLVKQLGLGDAHFIVGTIARLERLKGCDILLNVAEVVCEREKRVGFLIRGNGPLREGLLRDILQRGLAGRVAVSSAVLPAQELPDLYRSFDLFFLPTRREGFGMAFAEAMAMGVAVVGPKLQPVSDVVDESSGVLVEENDVNTYVETILRLLEDNGKRKDLGAHGRERARTMWGSNVAARRVLDVYLELAQGKGLA